MSLPLELVVYVHGVSNDLCGRRHTPEYEAMHKGVAARNPAWPSKYVGVEWGWNHDGGEAKSHQLLTEAQRHLGARALHGVTAPWDFTLNPARSVVNSMRPLMIYGFADIFYYVSADGKKAVRGAVATQIADFIRSETGGDETTLISLTMLGHSAGSVVCFDFLFYLFCARGHVYLDRSDPGYEAAKWLRELAQGAEKRLRLRRLITFGSPITMLACRSDPVLGILARGNGLDPRDYGLASNWAVGQPLSGARWINLWDRDDPIGWPVEPLMADVGDEPMVEDVYADVSDAITAAHDKYWRSRFVHRTIGEKW